MPNIEQEFHDKLRNLYYEDLSRLVSYDGKTKRARVKHSKNWFRVSETHTESINLNDYTNTVWIWSDHHFRHRNILKYSNRPFKNIVHMEDVMIENHNELVGKDDYCFWIGDFSFCNNEDSNTILEACNGHHILIVGNHDFHKGKMKNMAFEQQFIIKHVFYDEIDMVFSHYPMSNLPKELINIHGHVHVGSSEFNTSVQHINVNCEFWEYKPINMNKIIEIAKIRKISMEK